MVLAGKWSMVPTGNTILNDDMLKDVGESSHVFDALENGT